jgi:sulfur-oxidizing protein SoxX
MSMTKNRLMGAAGALAAALGTLTMLPLSASAAEEASAKVLEEGREIAFDRSLGNCLACHHIDGGQAAGTIGPPLIAMQVRFPDKEKLRAQIWDATVANPNSAMPPFGAHHIVSDEQMDKLVEFIWSL